MTYPGDNEVVTFGYNNNMLPVSVTGTDTYAQTIAYDSAMRMIQLVRGANKLSSVFDYNDWNVDGGRLQNLTTTRPADSGILQNSTYDYDVVGNIQTIIDSVNPSNPQTQTFQYDDLDRLTNSNVTGGTNGIYSEGYAYDSGTGNLASKNSINYTAYDTTHKHAVASLSNGNTYGYDDNGNMTSRHVLEGTTFKDFTLNYDAENRLVSVTGAATANFYYDADGKQVKAVVDGVTTYYVGNHYEVKSGVVTKYYFAGTTRIAARSGTNGTLSFLLADHLGSSSLTTDANGGFTASALYKAFGETRHTDGNLGTDYKFTGQREEASLGIYFFNARWFDPSLGRFTSPDTIVPTGTQGTQAWDRYAFVNNNPVRYFDKTGHNLQDSTNSSIGPAEVVIGLIIIGAIVFGIDNRRRHGSDGYCNESLASCFQKGELKKFSNNQEIDPDEFNEMLDAISDDLDSKPRTPFDPARADYDTPFFNGDRMFDGQPAPADAVVCIDGKCSQQSAVNYVAQGMYSARTGQSITGANDLANLWNSLYGHPASEDELYWLQYGYCYYYSTHNEDGSELPEVCTSQ